MKPQAYILGKARFKYTDDLNGRRWYRCFETNQDMPENDLIVYGATPAESGPECECPGSAFEGKHVYIPGSNRCVYCEKKLKHITKSEPQSEGEIKQLRLVTDNELQVFILVDKVSELVNAVNRLQKGEK